MIILPFQTNFSRFFDRTGSVPVPNTISLVIDDHVIECSGPILAQHSLILFESLTKSNEIHLNEFSGMVEGLLDCIEMLYGGDVVVGLDNLQALMKFSVLYKVQEMYDVCMDWVHSNACLKKFSKFFKIGHFVYTIEPKRPEMLEVCRDLVLSDEPANAIEIQRNNLEANEEDQSSLMMFFLGDGLMEYTLPTVTDWIDTNEKVEIVLDTIDVRDLFEPLSDQTIELNGLNFIKKLCEGSDTIKTSNKASALQSRLMESNYKKYKTNSKTKEMYTYLHGKDWTKLSGQALVDRVAAISTNHALYIEVCLGSPSQANTKALWPTINPALVGSNFCDNVQEDLRRREALFDNPAIEYDGDVKVGYFKALTEQQCASLVEKKPITVLLDCQVDGCMHKTPHAVTLKMEEDNLPCYNLTVTQRKDPASPCHLHPRSVTHWYITYLYNNTWGMLSLATQAYTEIIATLKRCQDEEDLNIANKMYVCCILRDSKELS